jgi:hypothetical protein
VLDRSTVQRESGSPQHPSLRMVPQYFGSLTTGNYVVTQPNNSDFSLMTGVDLSAFWETLKLRWWVIPAVVALTTAFMSAQKSTSPIEPGYHTIIATYEARDQTAVLASVGIDPVSVRAFPDANNQLLLLQSASVKAEIAKQVGSDVDVTVSRSRPSFTLVDTLESDGQSSFVFSSAGVPTYAFSCTEPAKSVCGAAIEAYVSKAIQIRKDALEAGLADLRAVLTRVSSESSDIDVASKIAAIQVLEERLDTPMLKVSEFEESVAPSTPEVRRPTYIFSIAAGVLVALLILLQLTYTDNRIRSMRQLARIAGTNRLLGYATTEPDAVGERRVAVGIHSALRGSNATTIRYLPLRQPMTNEEPLQRLVATIGTASVIARPFTELSVAELAQTTESEIDVVVVQRNKDLRKDLIEVLAALSRSGRRLAGVLLLD